MLHGLSDDALFTWIRVHLDCYKRCQSENTVGKYGPDGEKKALSWF
jgi:hypothetical protein